MLGRTEKKQLKKKSESDSELTVCDVCGQNHCTESCLFISIRPCTVEDAVSPARARLTLPANLAVKDLADGTTTVVTLAKFEKGTRFGPFLAPLTSILPPEVDFPLKIFGKSEEDSYYLDTRNEDDCNWMCLVGSVSSSDDTQNLFCYQVLDKIFFSLLRDIEAGEELRVWYAPFYGVKMGIPPGNLAESSVSEISDVSDITTKVNEPVTWEADTTTADVPPTEEEPQIAVRRSKRQPKNKNKHDGVDENQKKNVQEKNDEARTAYVAQQLPAIRLGARFSPVCWRCRECGVKEVSVINYARHLMQHLKQPAQTKRFPCSLCLKKFCSQNLLDEHEASRHGLSGLLPPVQSDKSVEISANPDDPLPVQECSVNENELKVPSPNIFGKSIDLCSKGKENSESEVDLTVSCVQQPCVMGPLSNGIADVERNLTRNESVSMDNCSTLTVIPAAQQDIRTNISVTESVPMKFSIAENCEKLEDSSRKLVAVMGENALQNLLIPIDQQKNLDVLLQNFQQPTREKPVSHPAKVPETILNHEFFTRVAGDTVVRDVKSLLSMGYSLQFLVENEDGSSSLVDVLSTANGVTADQVTSSSGASQSGEASSSQQLVIMANGNVPDSLPLALQNILPPSVPIVPNVVDPMVTSQTPLLADAPANSITHDSTATDDIHLPSCLDPEHSYLNKQSSTSDARSPLGTLLPSAITNNMCYDSVIPYTDSNSENASLMEMSLGGENLGREELDYELGGLELPLTVEDTNSTDYMINTCSTPPPNTVGSSSLCVGSNPDLNTPVKLLDRCIDGTLSSDVMTFDFEAGSGVPSNILSPQPEEKNSVCRDGLTKDFSDLIAADAESSNVMLTIQPADSTAEVRKESSIPSIELSNENEKDKSSSSLEWMGNEGLLLSVQRGSVGHMPETLILNSNEQRSMEVDFQPINVTDKNTSLMKDNSEETEHLRVTTSEINVELDGLLLGTHSNPRSTVVTRDELQINLQSQSQMQPKNQMHSQSEIHLQPHIQPQSIQFQEQTHLQVISQTQNQHWLSTHTNISTSAQTQCQSQMQNETQILIQMKSQVQDQAQIELQIHAPTDSNIQTHHQPVSEGQQELHASMDLGVITEEMETEVEQSCISSGPPFICDICNKSFEKVKYLYRHLRKHTGEFTCVACRAVFARKETLQLHECPAQSMRSGGNITDRLSCPFCRKQFTEKKQLTRHIAIHAGSRRFQCTTCDSSFTSKETAEHHIQRCSRDLAPANEQSQQVVQEDPVLESSTEQQSILPLRCELCKRMFSSDAAMLRHKMTVHQDPAQDCEHCGRALALATPERMVQHARFCAPAAVLQAGTADAAICPECNEPFRQLLLYRQHVYRHTHPFVCAHCRRSFCSLQEKGKHVCLDLLEQCCRCGHRFGTVPQLERHALTHGVPHYHCYECGRSFHLMTDFNQHRCFELRVKIVRPIPKNVAISEDASVTTFISSTSLKKNINQNQRSESEVLMCEICGEVCKSKRTLNVHRLLHGERKIVCGVCGKRFHRKDALVEHMYSHEDAQLRCSICNKLLKSQKSLEAHVRRQHTVNHKRFVCQQCGKEFHQKVNLKKHMKSHEPRPEPVHCPHCGRRFQFPDVLAKHIAEHMEVARFQCTQCNRSFVKEKSLRQHMTLHGPQGFSCPACGHTLKHRFSLRRHIMKNHPELSLGRKSTSGDHLETAPNNMGVPQSPEVLLTVSQLQLTTDGVQEISLPDDVAVENACLLEESAMECSEEMVLYVLQEPLPCLPLQEPST